ncbi:uncharacterized protein SEPMUDRAFT_147289, partial [Sphaerulina musiva SO2202]
MQIGPGIVPCLHADSWALAYFRACMQTRGAWRLSSSNSSGRICGPSPENLILSQCGSLSMRSAHCPCNLCCHCCGVSVTGARLASTSCRGSAGVFHRGRTALCWSTMQISSDCEVR